jgi:hypothetical protein
MLSTQLQSFKTMPLAKQQRIKKWWVWLKHLPEAEQSRLRQEWLKLDQAEKRTYIDTLQKRYGD